MKPAPSKNPDTSKCCQKAADPEVPSLSLSIFMNISNNNRKNNKIQITIRKNHPISRPNQLFINHKRHTRPRGRNIDRVPSSNKQKHENRQNRVLRVRYHHKRQMKARYKYTRNHIKNRPFPDPINNQSKDWAGHGGDSKSNAHHTACSLQIVAEPFLQASTSNKSKTIDTRLNAGYIKHEHPVHFPQFPQISQLKLLLTQIFLKASHQPFPLLIESQHKERQDQRGQTDHAADPQGQQDSC